ncbi:TPA: polymer-forming cytoskeletal protein [Morganella morganii]|nr:polymer-forming cytoskeletal protein [Morganella morganii]
MIAAGGIFEGNIRAGEAVCICGTLREDISAPDCAVSIMEGGAVAGNITARTLMVDGSADGECDAGDVITGGSGRFCGTLRYTSLTVIHGGVLDGYAEMVSQTAQPVVSGKKKQREGDTETVKGTESKEVAVTGTER